MRNYPNDLHKGSSIQRGPGKIPSHWTLVLPTTRTKIPLIPPNKNLFLLNFFAWKWGIPKVQVSSSFQLQVGLLAKSQPDLIPNLYEHTKCTTFLQVTPILLNMMEPKIWVWGAKMMSDKPNLPLIFPTCWVESNVCYINTF